MAVVTLPKAMRGFYQSNIGYITEHAISADKRRYVDSSEIPHHYFNADRYGKQPFKTIPRKWKDAVARYSKDTILKHGTLPWTIQQNYYWLVKAFKEHDTSAILRTSANLAHYIADAHVPLHLTLNHDGQLTNQTGIHSLWERRLPELFSYKYNLTGKAHYIDNPLTAAFRICQSSYNSADTVLRLERLLNKRFPPGKKHAMVMRGNNRVKDYSIEYCGAYHQMLKGMVERRMRGAIMETGSFWFSAWVDAGQPDLALLIKSK
ncbi:MAG: S1/P1 Nuclease [Sphingobacteriaceae bacterium]|nr:MAG: S1/P1 Nuclease [Sphingobacteriaceae bacterium]